jgi:transposase-like protein
MPIPWVGPDYGKLGGDRRGKIIKFGKTKAGHQRGECKACGQTFTETKGPPFYRRRTPELRLLKSY